MSAADVRPVVDPARLGKRIAELAAIGGNGTAVTRLGLSAEEQAARDLVGGRLAALGAAVRRDAAGNLIARFGGDGPAVLAGSHLDSVPDGGRFDGALGVLCAVEAVESLREAGARFRRPVEVVAWADEEGARFGLGLYGSCAAFGRLPAGAAERRDARGVSIAEALRALGERGEPEAARLPAGAVAAYLELHIEQGPRLERAGVALGVVSDIVGIFHARVTVEGRADHAGTTAMDARRDALAGAAAMLLAVEAVARSREGAVATVGEIAVRPGAKNVVPGAATFSLDVRAGEPAALEAAVREIRAAVRRVGDERGLRSIVDVLSSVPVTPLEPALRDLFRRAAAAEGVAAPVLVSGAGHDAMNAQLSGVPAAMLFVRSTGGSHTPREHCDAADAALGAAVLARALGELAC